MKLASALLAAVVLVALSGEAFALKQAVTLSPGETLSAQGFSIQVERRHDGRFDFTVLRDLAKSTFPDRRATLQVNGPSGVIVNCPVANDEFLHHLRYRFTIAESHASHSEFTLSEVQGNGIVGGGTIYTATLKDFLPKEAATEAKAGR